MKANPGGEVASVDVVGRDRFIARMWEVLGGQSVLMVAERRIGKTTVVKKMRAEPPADLQVIYRDVEGLRTPLEFAETVARDVESRLTGARRGGAKLRRLWSHLAGVEIGEVIKFPPAMKQHWKSLLEATIEDLLENHQDTTWVFIWDEITLMLQNIRRGEGEQAAVDVLDTLRGLRQGHARLRMVYTGSVGLHHVLSGVYTDGPLNDPTNDMRTMEVTELSSEDGSNLARALIEGEGLRCPELDTTAAAITTAVDHVAFYIHHVVARMKDLGDEATSQLAASIVEDALAGAQDPWHLTHYRVRLNPYYDPDRLPLVLETLDELCGAESLAFGDLARRVRSTFPRESAKSGFAKKFLDGDDEPLHSLINLLERDHYLSRQPRTGEIGFRFPLIRRWWKLHRGSR